MKTILIEVKVNDNSTLEDVERAISAGLDNNSIDCIYNVKEIIGTLKDVLSATDAILSEQKQTAEVEGVTESVTHDISEEFEELEEPDIEHGIHM